MSFQNCKDLRKYTKDLLKTIEIINNMKMHKSSEGIQFHFSIPSIRTTISLFCLFLENFHTTGPG